MRCNSVRGLLWRGGYRSAGLLWSGLPRCLPPVLPKRCNAPHASPPPPLQGGLAPRVVELLKRPNASAALPLTLLQMVRCMYEHHPRPKVRVCELVLAQHCLYSLLLPSCGSKVWRLGLH